LPTPPSQVLDAPELADDYYLNLVDWSSSNVLGVGLGSSVYTWSAQTSEVKKLCDLAESDPPDSITSINWVQRVRCLPFSPRTEADVSINRVNKSRSGRRTG
jgi:WD40 repeat protein